MGRRACWETGICPSIIIIIIICLPTLLVSLGSGGSRASFAVDVDSVGIQDSRSSRTRVSGQNCFIRRLD